MKKSLIITICVLAAGIIAAFYFLRRGNSENIADPFSIVSEKTAMVVESTDIRSLFNFISSGSGIMGEMSSIKEFSPFFSKLNFMTNQINRPEYGQFVENNKVLLSVQSFGDKTEMMLSLADPHSVKESDLRDCFVDSAIVKVTERIADNHHIYAILYPSSEGEDIIYSAIESGLVVFSSSQEMLVEAFARKDSDIDFRKVKGVSRLLGISSSKNDKMYLAYDNLTDIIKPMFGEENKQLAVKIGLLASSSFVDMNLKEDAFLFNGYTESTDEKEFLYGYKSASSAEMHSFRFLPTTTGFFETTIYDPIEFSSSFEGASDATKTLASLLKDQIRGEITKAYIDIKGRELSDNRIMLYELSDPEYAKSLFLDEFGKEGRGERMSFKPDDQLVIPIYRTAFEGFGKMITSKMFWEKDSYFSFYDNYLITGSSYATISKLLYDNILNSTLGNDIIYRGFEASLPSVSGYFLYFSPLHGIDYLSSFLSDKGKEFVKINRSSINKISAVGYQLSSRNDMIYNSVSVQYKEDISFESATEWETLLDTVAAIKPFFFTNHNTGAKEIFVQDLKNNIYLINASGRILWKVPLRERVNGSVYMVDIYKNNKYQLLFAGKEYLHIIDRNGNYVDRFPVKMRAEASNTLALFDYDNNKEYRLLIAGVDNQIYAYDKTGNVVKGWKGFKTASNVTSEISWMRSSGKDYLVVTDKNSVYFLDRTGNKRLTLKESVTRAPGSALRLVTGSPANVILTAPDGTIQKISFDGSVKKQQIREFSENHSFDTFDIDGNGTTEYIFIDNGVLYLYDNKGKELFTKQFGSGNLVGPITFTFSSTNKKIGVYSIDDNLIYLEDKKGEIIEGFTLRGASLFSIGKLSNGNKWNLIVGGTDRFLYNYKID
ncbi:MAG: hypothetical protein J6X92_07000 [Bacteroidales bacterium]|nr:hypothetical protein [Bacteroidales bacterium]